MFGLFNRRPVESRAAEIDAGALFATFFQFGGGGAYSWQLSPAVLASTLSNSDNNSALVNHSRRLSNVSPLLVSYRRAMIGGILTGEPNGRNSQRASRSASPRRRRTCGPGTTIASMSATRCTG